MYLKRTFNAWYKFNYVQSMFSFQELIATLQHEVRGMQLNLTTQSKRYQEKIDDVIDKYKINYDIECQNEISTVKIQLEDIKKVILYI